MARKVSGIRKGWGGLGNKSALVFGIVARMAVLYLFFISDSFGFKDTHLGFSGFIDTFLIKIVIQPHMKFTLKNPALLDIFLFNGSAGFVCADCE